VAANVFYTPQVVAGLMIGALVQDFVLPKLVTRELDREFIGGHGTVVNVRTPPTVTGGGARTYTQALRDTPTPIVLDRINEATIPVTMGPEIYKGAPLTDEDLTFQIADFTRQVVEPLAQPVGIAAEMVLAAQINSLTASTTIVPKLDGTDIHSKVLEARMALTKRFVPLTGRILAVSPEVEFMLLNDPANRLVRYDASGSSDALRNATIGRLYGMDVVVSTELTANSAVIFTREAFAFVTATPAIPAGCAFGATTSYQGVALRFLRDYDSAFLQDRAIVSTYAGAATLDANRAIRLVASL
jgi:hypothetical protein